MQRKKKLKYVGMVFSCLLLFCSACSQPTSAGVTPTATVVPTKIPAASPTEAVVPEPTNAAEETVTPEPTKAAEETVTPEPSKAAEETVTPEPSKAAEETVTPEPTKVPEETPTPMPTETPTPVPTEVPVLEQSDRDTVKQQVLQNIKDGAYDSLSREWEEWWFRRQKEHVPSGSGEFFDIGEFSGYYVDESATEDDPVIYMTLDCGYSHPNTPLMLDIFKKYDIKVMFFVTKFFIDDNPEYIQRMVDEGHLVGNHSVTHPNVAKLTPEEIYKEIVGCEEAFYEVTGEQMDLYFRPPQGAYSPQMMQIIEDLGYKTIFWSIAYYDYERDDQPGRDYVIDHFTTYHHNGAIPLMHNDSVSNREAMEEVLDLLKDAGYRFGTLDELE